MVVCVGLPVYHERRSTTAARCSSTAASRASSRSGSSPATASTTSRAGSRSGRRRSATCSARSRRRRASRRAHRSAHRRYRLRLSAACASGFEICEDAWVANRPGAESRAARRRHDPQSVGEPLRVRQVRGAPAVRASKARARSASRYLYANLLGNEAGRVIYDGGALDRVGRRAARARPPLLVPGPRAVDRGRRHRSQPPRAGAPRQPTARATTPRAASSRSTSRGRRCLPAAHPDIASTWEDVEPSTSRKRSSRARSRSGCGTTCARAAPRLRRLVVSGGADTAACAVLVALRSSSRSRSSARRACSRACRRARIERRARGGDRSAAVRRSSRVRIKPTAHSGASRAPPRAAVADAVGAEFHVLDVEPLRAGYVTLIERALGRPLTWDHDDVALQNIQARVRAPSIWCSRTCATRCSSRPAIAARPRSATRRWTATPRAGSRRSAASTRRTCARGSRWMETTGPSGLHAVPALSTSTRSSRPPSCARPRAAQTDEGDLMPYDVLEAIEDARDPRQAAPLEVLLELHAAVPRTYERRSSPIWIERFFKLWCRNQWKRERIAPSFHLDDENLDPRSWCRFPILSGGFERELAELRAYVRGHDSEAQLRVPARRARGRLRRVRARRRRPQGAA